MVNVHPLGSQKRLMRAQRKIAAVLQQGETNGVSDLNVARLHRNAVVSVLSKLETDGANQVYRPHRVRPLGLP